MYVGSCRQNLPIHLINASAVSAYRFYTDPFLRFTETNTHGNQGDAYLQDMIDAWGHKRA